MSSSKLLTREPLTSRQRSILFAFYDKNPYPSSSERHELVQLTGRTLKQVQDWFSNRRRTDPQFSSKKQVPPTLPQPLPLPPPPPPMPMPPIYYSPPPPLSICDCCNLPQPSPMVDHTASPYSMYYPWMNYYPPLSNFPS